MISLVRDNWNKIALMLIVLTGGFFAMWGADFGLPALLHPNEWTIVEPAIQMVENGTLVPDVFYRPDHLLIIMLAIIFRVIMFVFGISDISALGNEHLYLSARLLTGLFAVGTIIMAYLASIRYARISNEEELTQKRIGVATAFLFAFLPIYVREAHYATPDIPTVFFMVLFIYVALGYMKKSNIHNLILMAVVTGGFITIKYPGAILFGMIALCVLAASIRDRKIGRLFAHGFVSIISSLVTIYLISPVLFRRYDAVIDAIVAEARDTHMGYDGLGWFGNIWYYFTLYVTNSGVILLAFLAVGIYAIFRKKNTNGGELEHTSAQSSKQKSGLSGFLRNNSQIMTALPLLSGFAFWIALSYMPLHWERWALPMYVSPLLISGIGIVKGYEFIKTQTFFTNKRKLFTSIFATALIISALNLTTGATANLPEFLLPDTRIAAREFADENNITRENTLYENYTPFQLTFHGDFFALSRAFDYVGGWYVLKNHHIDYIIISSNMYDRFKAEPNEYPDQVAAYEFLAENFPEIKRFSDVYRNHSPIDFINIHHNISYLTRALKNGVVGYTLIFYEVPR